MGKPTKATKKFQSKHLKDELEHRKKVQKHKRIVNQHKKKRGAAGGKEESAPKGELFDNMSVEQFFEGGFQVPKEKAQKKQQDDASSSEEELDHQQDLEELKDQDPDFYKYLQENDKDLLDFQPVNPLDAMSDDEGVEETGKEDKVGEEEAEESKIEVTMSMVKQWNKILSEKPNIKTLKAVVMSFKAAVNVNTESEFRYTVTDSRVFQELTLTALKKLPKAIQTMVPYKKSGSEVRSLPQNNKKVTQIGVVLKSHAGSLLTLLNDITNTETAALVLSSVQEILPYFISSRRLLKQILTAVIEVWSTTKDLESQIAAFAFINNACREFTKPTLEFVLKSTYSSFVKQCRQTNIHTMPMINFQKNSSAELFGIDDTLSYQIGFEYIRQLAIHLRSSINNPTKDSYKTVYNWQFCHSLDFWSRVISSRCHASEGKKKESSLKQLIYPLVQVTLGTIRLIPTAQFFPLRFYLMRSLIRLSQNSGVFIPMFPLLAEIMHSTAFTRPPKSSDLQAVDFDSNIRVNQAYLGTKVYQDGLSEQFVDLCAEFFVLYCKSIAFPELVTPAVITLRRYMKKSKSSKFNKQLSQLVEKLNQNAKLIETKRSNVDFGPNNKTEVALFLNDMPWEKTPLGAYVVLQREVKEEKAKILRESLVQDDQDEKDDEMEDAEVAEEAEESEESSDDE